MNRNTMTRLTLEFESSMGNAVLSGLAPLFPGMITRGVQAVQEGLLKHPVCDLPNPHRLVIAWGKHLVYARYEKGHFGGVVCTPWDQVVSDDFLKAIQQKVLESHPKTDLGYQAATGMDLMHDAFWEGFRLKSIRCTGAPAPDEFLLLWPFYSLTFRLLITSDGLRLRL